MITPLLDRAGIDRLRAALTTAEYTPDGVEARLGPSAAAALSRGELLAVRHAATGDDPLATLIRLFVTGDDVPKPAAAAAFGSLDLTDAFRAGLLERHGDAVRAGLDLRPYGDDAGSWWVLSDLGTDVRPGPLRPDHVLGVGSASVTLAQATVRPPTGAALDLGTGCGVQALHLSRHVDTVTATDVNQRALDLAATTAALNGLRWELLAGDLTAPVSGRRFDLVVSNPPFVVGPGRATHSYRDSGRPGDAVSAELVAAAPKLLRPGGGWMQLLANWVDRAGEPWDERVAGWIAGTGCDGWAIQRELVDPAQYVALWLRDAGELTGPDAARRTSEWLDWFAAERIEAVGFGLITLHAAGADQPVVRVEEARQTLDQPIGPQVQAWFDRQQWLRRADLLEARLTTGPELRLQQSASRGPDGWEVGTQLLALDAGLRWAEEVDPLTVSLVGGCDGSTRLGHQLALLAAAHDAEPAALAAAALPLVAHLVERGFLLPADGRGDSGERRA